MSDTYANGLGAWQWRHNEGNGVSNHQRLDCLLNRLFTRRSKKTSKLRVTGLTKGLWRGKCLHRMTSSWIFAGKMMSDCGSYVGLIVDGLIRKMSLVNHMRVNWVNTLGPRQNGYQFPDDIFKCIFTNEYIYICISTVVSLELIRNGPFSDIPALVVIKPYMNQWWLVYWHICTSLGLNRLT